MLEVFISYLQVALSNIWTIGLQGVIAGFLILFFTEKLRVFNIRNQNANYAQLLLLQVERDANAWKNLSTLLDKLEVNAADHLCSSFDDWETILVTNKYTEENYYFWLSLISFSNNRQQEWLRFRENFIHIGPREFRCLNHYFLLDFSLFLRPNHVLSHMEHSKKIFKGLAEQSEFDCLILKAIISKASSNLYSFFIPKKTSDEKEYRRLLKKYENADNYNQDQITRD